MSQIALPLPVTDGDATIVGGASLQGVFAALQASATWPYRAALLTGPARSGKSVLARWFIASGSGDAIDDADQVAELDLFHRWNRAQADGHALLIVASAPPGPQGWAIALPDLASRIGAALHLVIAAPDDDLLRALLVVHAQARGLTLTEPVIDWLLPRIERSHAAAEAMAVLLDRLSLERKAPVTLPLARDALTLQRHGQSGGTDGGLWQPRLL